MAHPRVEVTDLEARLGTRYTAATLAALAGALAGGALRLADGGGQPRGLPPLGALAGDHGERCRSACWRGRATSSAPGSRRRRGASRAGGCRRREARALALPRAAGLDAGERADARPLVERAARARGVAAVSGRSAAGRCWPGPRPGWRRRRCVRAGAGASRSRRSSPPRGSARSPASRWPTSGPAALIEAHRRRRRCRRPRWRRS